MKRCLQHRQKVADIVAGHYKEAHREGVRRGLKISAFKVEEKVDVMVCSSHPADQDFWQSPKCAYAAEPGLKGDSGGTIVMVSPNHEGIGPHPEYPQCMGNDRSEEIATACLAGETLGDPLQLSRKQHVQIQKEKAPDCRKRRSHR